MHVRPVPKVSIFMAVTTKKVTEKAQKWAKMARFWPKTRLNGRVMAREIFFHQCLWITKFCAKFGRSRITRTARMHNSLIVLRCMWKEPAPLAVFGPKIHFWGGGSKTLGTLISGTPLSCWKCWLLRLQLAPWDKNVQSMPKKWVFWAKSQFFVWESRFLSTGHITSTPGAITFPFGPTQRKIPFRRYGSFWAILGQKPVKKRNPPKVWHLLWVLFCLQNFAWSWLEHG